MNLHSFAYALLRIFRPDTVRSYKDARPIDFTALVNEACACFRNCMSEGQNAVAAYNANDNQ